MFASLLTCAEEGFLVVNGFVALLAGTSHMRRADSGEEMAIQRSFVSVFCLPLFISALLSLFFLHGVEGVGTRVIRNGDRNRANVVMELQCVV